MKKEIKDILEKLISKVPSKWFAESEKRKQEKEIREYFRPRPAKTLEEAEEWCKRKLNK